MTRQDQPYAQATISLLGTYCGRKHLRHPHDMGIRRPGKPEERNRQDHSRDDHGWQTLLWNGFSVLDECSLVVSGGAVSHEGRSHQNADQERDKRQIADANAPPAIVTEGVWELYSLSACFDGSFVLRVWRTASKVK